MGDAIRRAKSHQSVVNELLQEFSSWHGLRVKVFPRGWDNEFPGGFEYHNYREYMQEVLLGKRTPYIFHMSWTENKDNKKKYFEQMGEWYAMENTDSCSGIDCCLPKPNITCHYRDKPSKLPCHKSPPAAQEGSQSTFW
jgi:hypothetical protein